jgi:predicted nucleic acid-binding Zn ribbon protein
MKGGTFMNIEEQLNIIRAAEIENQKQFCQNCHRKLKQIQGRKEKKFCCDKCRMAWWYKKRRGDFDTTEKPASGMTERQKEYIRIRRNLGCGYQRIASELHLKKHQVRDYCRYHGLTGIAEHKMLSALESRFGRGMASCTVKNYCWFCGNEIKLTRKFCCDKCRYDYHNQRRSVRKARELED